MIEKHEKQKKDAAFDGVARGTSIAGVDAAGATRGSVGLIAFALVVWWLLPQNSAWIILPVAGIGWLVVVVVNWWLRKAMTRTDRVYATG